MFGNKCLGELKYEGTTSAIVMAGLFLSFIVEYVGHRIVLAKTKASASLTATQKGGALLSADVVSILVMEAGILFHSLCKYTLPVVFTLSHFANSCPSSDWFDAGGGWRQLLPDFVCGYSVPSNF